MTFDSRNHGRPSASTIRSARERCSSPIALCASSASAPGRRGHAGIDPGRRVEPGLARGVPLLEAVEPAARHDLHRRQRLRAAVRVDHADGDLGADDPLLDQGLVRVGERVHQRPRQLVRRLHDGDALRRPAAGRLHDQSLRHGAEDRVDRAAGADLPEHLPRQRDGGGGVAARGRDDALRGRLVPRETGGGPAAADVGQPGDVEQGPERAVLAARAVQRGPDDVGPLLEQRRAAASRPARRS